MTTYKLKLTALSPIHIGTGDDYEPTNFVINNEKFFGFDAVLFYKSLKQHDKDIFNQRNHNWLSIIDFYKSKTQEAIQIANFECRATKKVDERYQKLKNEDGTRNTNQFQISQTFKNPNTFRAIIPGSSIKGMFDTIFKIYPPKSSNEVRQKLIISDALMVSGNLEIGFSYRKNKNPSKSEESKIPQMVEVIKPNSTFLCQIKSDYDFTKFQSMMKNYHDDRIDSKYAQTNNSFIGRVGKYCGKEYMVDNGANVTNSYGKAVSTHTVYEVNNEPFGWIKFELISDDDNMSLMNTIRKSETLYYSNLKEKQKDIFEAIQKSKDEMERLRVQKEQMRLQELKEKEDNERLELERRSMLSPLELKLDELYAQNSTIPKTTLILNSIKKGILEEFKIESLKLLKELMVQNNEWKEKPTGKKPEKDKEYQKTLEVKKLFEN